MASSYASSDIANDEGVVSLTSQKVVGIVLFNEVEVLDYCGPFEVFSTTRINMENRHHEPSPFKVVLVSEMGEKEIIRTRGGMKVIADVSFEDCPKLDIILVPGGMGTVTEMKNKNMLDFIRNKSKEVELLTSVCTGSILLASAGLLNGLEATTHYTDFDGLGAFPKVIVVKDQHVVHTTRTSNEEGGECRKYGVITSAGISAGIDLSLQVVAKLFSEHVARSTAKFMEYPYPEDNTRRVIP